MWQIFFVLPLVTAAQLFRLGAFREPLRIYVPVERGTRYNVETNQSYIGMTTDDAVVLDLLLPVGCDGHRITAAKGHDSNGNPYLTLTVPCGGRGTTTATTARGTGTNIVRANIARTNTARRKGALNFTARRDTTLTAWV